jgi:fructose-1,6-bisphosphatase/inositol monophosphatase family enzyme
VAAASVILEEAGACLIDDGQSPVRIDQDREARLQVVAAADIELARDLLGVGIQAASPV